jgi:hypothetical protein
MERSKDLYVEPLSKVCNKGKKQEERIQQKMNFGNEMRNISVSQADCYPVSEANY